MSYGGLRGGRTWQTAEWGTLEGVCAGGNGELALNSSDVKTPRGARQKRPILGEQIQAVWAGSDLPEEQKHPKMFDRA